MEKLRENSTKKGKRGSIDLKLVWKNQKIRKSILLHALFWLSVWENQSSWNLIIFLEYLDWKTWSLEWFRPSAFGLGPKTFLTPCFSILILKKNIKLHLDKFSTHFVRTMREGKYHFSGLENIYFCRVTWKEKNRVGTSFSKGQLFIFWDQQDSCLSSAVRLDGPGDQGDGKVGPRKISFLKNFCLLSG